MGNHIEIVFGPTLYFIPINCNSNFIRLSQLEYTQLEGEMVSYISFVFCLTKFHVGETYVLYNVIGAVPYRLNQFVRR